MRVLWRLGGAMLGYLVAFYTTVALPCSAVEDACIPLWAVFALPLGLLLGGWLGGRVWAHRGDR
jgi:hypothetical protein